MRAPGTPSLLRRLACCGPCRRTAPRDSAEALATSSPPAAAATAAPSQGGCAGCLSKLRALCCRTRSGPPQNAPAEAGARWLDSLAVRLPKLAHLPKLPSLPSMPKPQLPSLPKLPKLRLHAILRYFLFARDLDVGVPPGAFWPPAFGKGLNSRDDEAIMDPETWSLHLEQFASVSSTATFASF